MDKMFLLMLVLAAIIESYQAETLPTYQFKTKLKRRYLQEKDNITSESDSTLIATELTSSPVSAPVVVEIPDIRPSYVVDLLDFSVTMDNLSHFENVANFMEKYLVYSLSNEFLELRSVGIIERKKVVMSDKSEIFYFGKAKFYDIVSKASVHDVQRRALSDLDAVQEYVPNVVSIMVMESGAQWSPAGLIVVVIVGTLAMCFALKLCHRYYHTQYLESSPGTQGELKERVEMATSAQEENSNSTPIDDGSIGIDDNSFEGYSTMTDIESVNNKVKLITTRMNNDDDSSADIITAYASDSDNHISSNTLSTKLESNFFHRTSKDCDETASDSRDRKDDDLEDQGNTPSVAKSFDESEADFSYSKVGKGMMRMPGKVLKVNNQSEEVKSVAPKHFFESDANTAYEFQMKGGMESDDEDLYMTDYDTVTSEMNQGSEAVFRKRFSNLLGGDPDSDEDDIDILPISRNREI
jgi:hypothetical protein